MDIDKIKQTLNTTRVPNEILNQLVKDRLDFGFDSIYFRYAIIRDELAYFKARESHDLQGELFKAKADKMHFYNVLEQLTQAHKSDSQVE